MRTATLAGPDAATSARYFNRLAETLDTEELAVNYFERAPGESVGDFYHRHNEQEEVFVVLAGTATFETEDGDVGVEAGEAVRFAPGEWQQGWNRGNERLRLLALGAPREEGPTDLREDCPACESRADVVVDETDSEAVFSCAECGEVLRRYP